MMCAVRGTNELDYWISLVWIVLLWWGRERVDSTTASVAVAVWLLRVYVVVVVPPARILVRRIINTNSINTRVRIYYSRHHHHHMCIVFVSCDTIVVQTNRRR